MSDVIDIGMGDLKTALSPVILTTSSIGSCVAVCLYSHADKKGGLAHIMLPKHPNLDLNNISAADYRFADVAIAVVLTELERNGVARNHLIAKIAGGANMFPDVQGRSHKVGDKNVESVKEILKSYTIDLAAEDTGGHSGRAVTFDPANGIVTIKVTI